ncbi:uncharacterized protein LOC132543580 [Ylistrum balloti]|uniref:uncharacterized protein LOC132543580 n=1 Tax=Ylistrum balloti TaxID=509963 RepID=UPI002905F77B|nr:uncharacterized protein LOC132543580 [Ylistrum balloti]
MAYTEDTQVPELQVVEMKEVFSLLDKDCDGLIPVEHLGPVLRSMGLNPTEESVKAAGEEFKSRENRSLNFDECLKIATELMQEPDETEESLREAFQAFDKERIGWMDSADLRQIMINLGERLTEEEASELIEDANGLDGHVKYGDFIKLILSDR